MKYLIFISILLLSSCNMQKYVANHPNLFPPDSILITNTIIQTDSVTFTETDTMAISLLFECDSNNNVLMRELNDLSSKGIETNITFKDNRLDISGYVDSIAILNKIIETTKNKEVVKMNPINAQLKQENEQLKLDKLELKDKAKRKNKIIFGLIAAIIGLLLVWKLIK